MKSIKVAIAAVTIAVSALALGAVPAVAAGPSKTIVKTDNYVKLSATQVENFAVVYCINVNTKGADQTKQLFSQVASQDAISPTQQTLILALAGDNC